MLYIVYRTPFMGKIKKAVTNTLIGLWIASSFYAQNSKVDTNIVSTKKDLIENVKKNIQTDKGTDTIISFLADNDNELMNAWGKKFWYTPNHMDSVRMAKDPILYETMKELNQKYGNPKITMKRPKDVNENKYEWCFSKKENTIYINPKHMNGYSKKRTVSTWLAELSHSKQHQKKYMTWREIKDRITLIQEGFNYDKLYNIKWTMEYEAHKIIEPELIHEFIKTYISKIDTNNIWEVEKAEDMMDYYYDYTRKQADTLEKKLQFIVNKEKQKELAEENEIEELKKKIEETNMLSKKLLEEMKKIVEKNEEMAKELEKELLKTP